MRNSRMIGSAAIGGLCLIFAVHSAGVGQQPIEQTGESARGVDPPLGVESQLGASRYSQPAAPAASSQQASPRVTPMAVAEGMLGFASPDSGGGQVVTLVDARRSWMAVYAVDAKGEIRLLSSRPLQQDFSVQYNVTDPTPADIGRLNPR